MRGHYVAKKYTLWKTNDKHCGNTLYEPTTYNAS